MPRRLSVLAGSGALVSHVVDAALAQGDTVQVIAFTPQPARKGVPVIHADLADPAAAIAQIAAFRSSHVVLAGALTVSDRQREALAGFASGGASPSQGDAALSGIVATIEQLSGARIVGVHEIAAGLLAPEGIIAGAPPDGAALASARLGLEAARAIGRIDLGQAVVVSGSRVVAAEDVGGTDELLRRVAEHRRAGRVGDGGAKLVLSKAAKPQQPLHVDLPAIGLDTIAGCAAAGVGLIALEAGRTLLLERPALVAAATAAGISVIGLAGDG